MKLGRVAVAAQVLGAVVAHPHGYLQHDKRAGVVVTATVWETVQAPDVVVVVNENGKIISQGVAAVATPATTVPDRYDEAPSAAAPAPTTTEAPVVQAPPQPKPEPAVEVTPPKEEPVEEKPPSEPAKPPTIPSSEQSSVDDSAPPFINPQTYGPDEFDISDQIAEGYGLGWSGYKGTEASSACKTYQDADKEWAQMSGYDIIRVYGTDCDQPGIALNLAQKYGKKVFLGVYWLDDRLSGQVQNIISAVENCEAGWDIVDTVSVGNEDIHRGEKSADQVANMVSLAKGQLRAAGYRGPVVHVDTQDAFIKNPSLCSGSAGDYIAANVHPFFNNKNHADKAGDFVQREVELLKQCAIDNGHPRGENVVIRITETGWPKDGHANGVAVPSKDNQNAAVASIKDKVHAKLILFSAFDNKWMKNDASTFNTEHFWGMLDA